MSPPVDAKGTEIHLKVGVRFPSNSCGGCGNVSPLVLLDERSACLASTGNVA